jgi:uncharacterized protein YjbJ (UPF0337 family)
MSRHLSNLAVTHEPRRSTAVRRVATAGVTPPGASARLQAVGAVTGGEGTKREGERQEDRGKLKGKLDSAVGKAQDALEALKDKADRR